MNKKILITADIHLNLSKNSEWERSRFLSYFDILSHENVDMIILAGDIFDKAQPTLQEIETFYQGIDKLKDKEVIVIAGNHEKVDVNTTTFDYLPKVGFTYYKDLTELNYNKTYLHLLPHQQLHKLKDIELKDGHNILISHFRSSSGMFKQEIDVGYVSKVFDDCIAGDIHTHYQPYPNVEYTSQPYNTKYEMVKDNGFIILEIKPKTYKITYYKVNLPNKIKLELSAEEYKNVYNSLSESNLYKIVIYDRAENVKDLPTSPNILLTFKPTFEISEEQLDEIKQEIQNSGNIDVVNTLKRLVRESEELDNDTIESGEEMIDMIHKGII